MPGLNVLLASVSVVLLATRVSVASGIVRVLLVVCDETIVVDVPVVPAASNFICLVLSTESTIAVEASTKLLFVRVSVVALPTRVSVDVGSVSVPVLTIVAITGAVKVLFVRVSVVALPTNVSVASGRVNVLLVVWDDNNVVDVPVVPAASNLICLVLSTLSTIAVDTSTKLLFVRVSVVALPTKVSVEVGKVNVPVLLIEEIIGVVRVLLVRV